MLHPQVFYEVSNLLLFFAPIEMHLVEMHLAELDHDSSSLLALRNSSTVFKALKNSGVPAKDSGLTGPMVINEYCLLAMSKAEWGSRKSCAFHYFEIHLENIGQKIDVFFQPGRKFCCLPGPD